MDLDAVGAVLDQIMARDPASTVFRYPVTKDKDGNASLSRSERIDIRNFAEVANRVLTMLDCCADGLRETFDDMCAMEWESRE